jgi:DNA polymerase-1
MGGLITTPQQFAEAIEILKPYEMIGFDTETDGLHGALVGFSFGVSEEKGWYVPVRHGTLLDIDQPSIEQVREIFGPFFMDKSKRFCGWNIGYDLKVLWREGLDIAHHEDAQLLGWLLDENKPKALKERAKIEKVTDATIAYKDVVGKKSAKDVPASIMAPYAIQDIVLPLKLYRKFLHQLLQKDKALVKHYVTVELPFCRLLAEMSHTGITIDLQQLSKVRAEAIAALELLKTQIHEESEEVFNISSPQQLGYVLYDKLKYPILKHTPTGSPSTDAAAMEKLAEAGYSVAKLLLEYSKNEKLLTSFAEPLAKKADAANRIHTSFNQTGTVTGRLSSSDPNLQQIPRNKEYRKIFIAPSRRAFVIADYSQLELRMLAHFSRDEVMVDAFTHDKDLHAVTASLIYEIPLEDVDKEQRQKAKTVNFKIVYGGGVDLDRGITKAFLNRWYSVHRGAKAYIEAHKKMMLQTQGVTQTLHGRYRSDYEGIKSALECGGCNSFNCVGCYSSGSTQRALFSAHVQGSAADVVKQALLNANKQLKEHFPTARILLQIHDEIITECDYKDAEEIAVIVKREMENVHKLNVPLVVDPSIGLTWAEKD